jgi:hypothetical protein
LEEDNFGNWRVDGYVSGACVYSNTLSSHRYGHDAGKRWKKRERAEQQQIKENQANGTTPVRPPLARGWIEVRKPRKRHRHFSR